jgi:hypothetical protein
MPGSIPKDKYIDVNTISQQIDKCIDSFLDEMGISKDYNSIVNIKHSTVNLMMSYIYEHLFKPNQTLCNNQNSYVDYENIELLTVLANKFIQICQRFNKSLGLMSFGYMLGADYSTLYRWLNAEESNSPRCKVLKYIQESHKTQQISLLNDSPVGALAVANNDIETGLEWSKQQALLQANNTVFLLPSERLDKLKLPKAET